MNIRLSNSNCNNMFRPDECSRQQMYQYMYEFLNHRAINNTNFEEKVTCFKAELVTLIKALLFLYPMWYQIDLNELADKITRISVDENEDNPNYHHCEVCHKKKKDVGACIDPYEEEIYNKIIPRVLCQECYDNLGLDI